MSNVERGTLSDIQVIPVIIPEIIYPPNPPRSVCTYIEAAINAHNEGNFVFALTNYQNAKKEWNLPEHVYNEGLDLYFEYQRGSVFESAGRDDLAMSSFLTAKTIAAKLPLNSPDRALAYCGLGMVLYNVEEWQLSLRCFLKVSMRI